jgi:hypothetical protein
MGGRKPSCEDVIILKAEGILLAMVYSGAGQTKEINIAELLQRLRITR